MKSSGRSTPRQGNGIAICGLRMKLCPTLLAKEQGAYEFTFTYIG
jgi:hypothetical protein